jgi:hypothetical protein
MPGAWGGCSGVAVTGLKLAEHAVLPLQLASQCICLVCMTSLQCLLGSALMLITNPEQIDNGIVMQLPCHVNAVSEVQPWWKHCLPATCCFGADVE